MLGRMARAPGTAAGGEKESYSPVLRLSYERATLSEAWGWEEYTNKTRAPVGDEKLLG